MSTAAERQEREHGSRIITALERAWAAIRARHPEGTPKDYQLRGHHRPERWVTDPAERRMPELFIAGEVLATGGRAVLEVMLHEGSHALAVVRASSADLTGARLGVNPR